MPQGGWAAGGRRADAAQSQSAGWLWEPLLLLHHSHDPRSQPFSAARGLPGERARLSQTPAAPSWCSPASTWGVGAGISGRQRTLEELVSEILHRTSLPRLRLSSIEPMDWTPQLLALFRDPIRPGRAGAPRPSAAAIGIRCHSARHASPLSALALCGETAPDSRNHAGRRHRRGRDGGLSGRDATLCLRRASRFIAAQPFTYLHLFPFSARPGTTGVAAGAATSGRAAGGGGAHARAAST